MDVKSKVAVVVVHGVAYHAPGASARAASELLHGLRLADKKSPYGPDTEETISIPLKQLKVSKPLSEPEGGWIFRVPVVGFFAKALQERTVYLTRAWKNRPHSDERAEEKVANDFMRLLLQDYHGVDDPVKEPEQDEHDEAASYITTCIKMMRADTPPSAKGAGGSVANAPADKLPHDPSGPASRPAQPAKEVHIYESYWADLSRPKSTILSFFQGLYQLLFHLGSLSRLAISTGNDAPENKDRIIWWLLDGAQRGAVRILTLLIPIFNVILFVSILGALPHLIGRPAWAVYVAIVAAALLGLLLCVFRSPRIRSTSEPLTWAGIPIAFAVVSGGLGWLLSLWITAWSAVALEGWIAGAGIIYLSISSYDEVRDGAREVAWTIYGASFLTFLVVLWSVWGEATPIEQATLWMMQIVLAELRASWFLLIIFAFAALVFGGIAWRSLRRCSPERARAKAAVRTSRFALALPALGILIVTLALWSGLFVKTSDKPSCAACPSWSLATKLFGKTIPVPLPESPQHYKLMFDREEAKKYIGIKDPTEAKQQIGSQGELDRMTPGDYFRGLFVWSATPAFPIVLLLLLAGLFLMILWVSPSVFSERKPPRGSDNASSRRMGAWLSRGLDATSISVILMWTAAFFLPVFFMILHEQENIGFKSLDSPTVLILQWLGVGAGSLAILASLAKSGSSVLGIILDVDNYLRTSPKEKTPRARIVERYVSLLQYLADEERKYDRIVILAHSLGALISGDLLLYLKSQGDSDLKRLGLGEPGTTAKSEIPLRLFTMGDPARQFMNRFFPYLYEWIRPEPDNALRHLGELAPTPPRAPIVVPPDPRRLGLELWVNAYRSGDYIGRSLWVDEWYNRTDGPGRGAYPAAIHTATSAAGGPQFEEMCIGAGAHQHYWDQSAPDIAEKLDLLISP
jgi:MFS family permease